ncbi:MAG: tudor domain-containing protein [Gemmatimonadota bacterium]|nr:tudor domain-containing protein [Gemmatimonadota bacterium]
MRLTDEELRDVLARAEEIQRASRHGHEMNAELQAVIGAAEEMGLARPAVERALRERLDLSVTPPEVGTLAFARSADGKFYVAEVLSISTDGVRVRFLRGSEHLVTLDQLRPCSFIPGERLVCNWPWWGPWTCTVVTYDAVKQRVKLSDGWGYTSTFPVAEVWLPPARKAEARGARARVYATLIGTGAGLGALVGSIITALLMR